MAYDVMAIEQETVQRELRQVFDKATTEVLGQVLGRMAARAEELRVTREEFQLLRATVQDLAPAQRRTDRTVQKLAEAQQRAEERLTGVEERLTRLEETVQRLAEAQQRTEEAVQRLAEAQQRTEAQVRRLAQEVGAVKGRQLELTYQQRAGAYFGPLLRRVRAFLPIELEDELEARLAPEEFRDLLRLDLLIRGQPRYREEAPEVWLAVEISAVIDRHDVGRALRRAGYLRRASYLAIPTVAGDGLTEGATREAEAHNVLVLLDGRTLSWKEALDDVLARQQTL